MIKLLLAFSIAFFVSLPIGFAVIKIMKKHNAKQTVLHYVDNHASKSGTPTLGGLIFIIPTLIVTLIFSGFDKQLALIALGVTLSYGIVGFLDDFIKILYKKNLGLKAYQKIIAQAGIAIIMAYYCYKSNYVGESIYLPFANKEFVISWWIMPLTFLVYIATTNAVNLTDGLDGLAGSCSFVSFSVFGIILIMMISQAENLGNTLYFGELLGLGYFVFALLGGLLGFLIFNSHPAKIFMGDTGSLALGGGLATVALFLKNPFLILIIGIMFVLSSISVIIQVVYFKLSKGKRIFLMAPFHHHLQYKGVRECKIVAYYTIISILAGALGLMSVIGGL